MIHLLCPDLGFSLDLGRYSARYASCLALIAPLRLRLINSTASSYLIPSSINAIPTKTGALNI